MGHNPTLSRYYLYGRHALEIVGPAFSYLFLLYSAYLAGKADAFLREVNTIISTVLIAYSLLWLDWTLSDLAKVPERIKSVALQKGKFKNWKNAYDHSLNAWKFWKVKSTNHLMDRSGLVFAIVGAVLIDGFYFLFGAADAYLKRYSLQMLSGVLVLQGAPLGAVIGFACWILIFQRRHVYTFYQRGKRLCCGPRDKELQIHLTPFHWDGSWGLRQLIRSSIIGSIAMTFGLLLVYAELFQSTLALDYPVEFRIGFLIPGILAMISLYFLQHGFRFAIETERARFLEGVSRKLNRMVEAYIKNPKSNLGERIDRLETLARKIRETPVWKTTQLHTAFVADLAISLAPILVEQLAKTTTFRLALLLVNT